MPLPDYIKLGLFAVRLSKDNDDDNDDTTPLPRLYLRTTHLRRYFHEENDPYAPYACEKYSAYRAHKQRWEERQTELRQRERERAEARRARDGRLIEAERRAAPETERALVLAEGRRRDRKRLLPRRNYRFG